MIRHTKTSAAIRILGLVCLSSTALRADMLERRIGVEDAMRRANDYFQESHAIGDEGWERSTYQTGNFRAWEILGIQPYYDRAAAWGEANAWDHGTDYGDTDGSSADAHCCGQTYIDLYRVDPQPVRTNIMTQLLDSLLLDNRPDSIDDWWWIDAFYMAGSTLARLGVLNSDTAYLDQMYDMYEYMKLTRGGGLFNAELGLWWRDSGYKSSAPDTYWGRGNGWVIASCARVLEQLPAGDTVYRPEFEAMLRTMAAALLPWQQADGFWRSDITHPEIHPNPETSGTAFFTYAIAYGLNEGILVDAPGTNYTDAITNAWNGLVSIALHPDGRLGYTQAVGSNPQPATYESERDYGYGAFLLAGGEVLRLLGGPAPVSAHAGPDVAAADSDGDYAEPVMLSASNTVLRSGGIERYTWWCGPVLLGSEETLNLDFPLGTNTVTLKIDHSDGPTYSDTLTVVVRPPRIEVSASGYQSGNPPENTLDGRLDTRWSQEGSDGSEWVEYALPEIRELGHIDIAVYAGDTRQARFALWLSTNRIDYVRVLPPVGDPADYVTSSGSTLELETYAFPGQTVKSIRIQGWGNSASAWNSITEVSIPVPLLAVDDQTDVDANGLPDSWEIHYLGSTGQVPSNLISGSGFTLEEAYERGLNPVMPDTAPMVGIQVVSNQPILSLQTIGAFGVGYQGLTRVYSILTRPVLTNDNWEVLSGHDHIVGDNLGRNIPVAGSASVDFYAVESRLE